MARAFPGTNGFGIEVGDLTDCRFLNTERWTLCVHAKRNSGTSLATIVAKWSNQFILLFDGPTAGGPYQVDVRTAGTVRITSSQTLAGSTYYWFFVTNNGTGASNGLELSIFDDSHTLVQHLRGQHAANDSSLTDAVRIGVRDSSFSALNGAIDHVLYAKAALSLAEMRDFMREPVKTAEEFTRRYGFGFYLPMVTETTTPEPDWSGRGGTYAAVNTIDASQSVQVAGASRIAGHWATRRIAASALLIAAAGGSSAVATKAGAATAAASTSARSSAVATSAGAACASAAAKGGAEAVQTAAGAKSAASGAKSAASASATVLGAASALAGAKSGASTAAGAVGVSGAATASRSAASAVQTALGARTLAVALLSGSSGVATAAGVRMAVAGTSGAAWSPPGAAVAGWLPEAWLPAEWLGEWIPIAVLSTSPPAPPSTGASGSAWIGDWLPAEWLDGWIDALGVVSGAPGAPTQREKAETLQRRERAEALLRRLVGQDTNRAGAGMAYDIKVGEAQRLEMDLQPRMPNGDSLNAAVAVYFYERVEDPATGAKSWLDRTGHFTAPLPAVEAGVPAGSPNRIVSFWARPDPAQTWTARGPTYLVRVEATTVAGNEPVGVANMEIKPLPGA